MTPQVISLSAAGSTAWIPVDYKQNPFNISLAVVLSNTPSLTCKVEYTLDDVFNTSITPTVFTVPGLSAATINSTGSIITPVKAIRLTISSWTSGTATLTAIQGMVDSTGWQSQEELLNIHNAEHEAMGIDSSTLSEINAKTIFLLSGQEHETYAGVSATITADTVNYVIGDRSVNMAMAGAVTGQLRLDYSPALTFGAAQAIGISIYIPDSTKVTAVEVDVYQDSGLTIQWARSKTTGLVNGWNHFRFMASAGTITEWGLCYRLRVMVTTNAATNVSVGAVWAEVREKASIMIINDGPYDLWIREQYPWFRDRHLPVVFAPDVAILGTGSGLTLRATEAQISDVALDGNGNEISFHGYDGTATSAMTNAQLKTDCLLSKKWLMERGYFYGSLWRAAYVQNLATNAASCNSFLLFQATSTGTTTPDVWPPINPDNIGRMSVHGRTPAVMDTQFDNLKKTRGIQLFYYHNVDSGGGTNATPAEDAYLKSKIESGIAEGWLEVVTFKTLYGRLRGSGLEENNGRIIAKLTLIDGTVKSFIVG